MCVENDAFNGETIESCAHNLIARLAISLAGHDSGGYFLIVGVDTEGYVLLCNGKQRNIFSPKRKKLKHVRILDERDDALAKALIGGKAVSNADVQKAIRAMVAAGNAAEKGLNA